MDEIVITKSNAKNKKFAVKINDKTINFGDSRYEDYTTHRNKDRRRAYRTRHARDNINDPNYAGFWSYWLLWGHSTDIKKNARVIARKLGKKIKFNV